MKPGDRVRLPEGGEALVVGEDAGLVCVQLDGAALGFYPPERLAPAEREEEG